MNQKRSNFKSDLHGEKVLGQFLDQFFYNKLNVSNYERIEDRRQQLRGIDVEFNINGEKLIIDEKAQLTYPSPLPTFAFELFYKMNGQWKQGWLYDNTKATNYYLLAWPKRKDVHLTNLTVNDINTVEVILINRKKLVNYLFETAYVTPVSAMDMAVDLIKRNIEGPYPENYQDNEFYFYYTKKYKETPVNLIIRKKTLIQLAKFHFIIDNSKTVSEAFDSNKWLKEQFQTPFIE